MAATPSTLRDVAAPAYEDYVGARWNALYRTAYLLTGSHADAEDLAQTTLVKAYQSWAKVAAAASPDAYVRRIMTNSFISSRRPLRASRERLVDSVPDVQVEAAGSDDERLLLWPHIAALPPKQRAVIVLRYYEDLSETQIAEALGCSAGTVKSNASLALQSLRRRMDETEGATS